MNKQIAKKNILKIAVINEVTFNNGKAFKSNINNNHVSIEASYNEGSKCLSVNLVLNDGATIKTYIIYSSKKSELFSEKLISLIIEMASTIDNQIYLSKQLEF